MSIENQGHYNPYTYEDVRAASGAVANGLTVSVAGGEKELWAGMVELEMERKEFVWTETTSLAVPEHAVLSPRFLQSKHIRPEHLDEVGVSRSHASRIAGVVWSAGPQTYADLLALGSDALIEASRHVFRALAIGEKSLGYLRAAAWRQTGYRLPVNRATPLELLAYYDEVELATVALILPYGKYRTTEAMPGHIETLGEAAANDLVTVRGLAKKARKDFILPFYEAKLRLS